MEKGGYNAGGLDLLAFLPGNKAVVAAGWITDSSPEGYHVDVKVIEVSSGKVRKEFTLPKGQGMRGVLSPDGKTLIVSSPYEVAVLYDLATGKETGKLVGDERMPGPAREIFKLSPRERLVRWVNETCSLAISSDGKWLAVGTKGGFVSVWDIGRKRRMWRKQPYDRDVDSLSFSPDGELVAALARFTLNIWKRSGGVAWFEKDIGFQHCAFMPDGKSLLLNSTQSRTGFIRWDPAQDRLFDPSWKMQRGEKGLHMTGMALSANGETLVGRLGNRQIEIWDLRKIWKK